MKLALAVIVLQNSPEVLEEIGLCINAISPDAFKRTFFVTSQEEALACMAGATRTVVISGNVISSMCLGDGIKFAADVKAERPEVSFLMYSTHPTPDPIVDGYIPKAGLERLDPARHLPLAEVVARITDKTTLEDILRFPEVLPWHRVAA